MDETIAFFAVKSIGLSRVNGRKLQTLLQAARHNLREIQAEQGAVGRIDPRRISDNIVLHGPVAAAEVQAHAKAVLAAAGINTDKLRRDHCEAIEAVFSLPPDAVVGDRAAYFARCLEWIAGAMVLPVLSAVVHRDESAQHLHVLLVPVRDRVHVGSAPIDRIALKRLRDSFFAQVAGPAGLKRTGAKVRGVVKQWAVAAVLSRCEAMGLPAATGPVWTVLVSAIERDPTAAMLALGININNIRPCAAKPETNPIGIEANPIGIEKPDQKTEPYLCVGIASPAPSPKPQKAVCSLRELWLLVGCKLAVQRADRLRRARAALQAGTDRHAHRAPASTAPCVIDSSVTRVERDEHTHDTSVWD
jgi:hypothetical protein